MLQNNLSKLSNHSDSDSDSDSELEYQDPIISDSDSELEYQDPIISDSEAEEVPVAEEAPIAQELPVALVVEQVFPLAPNNNAVVVVSPPQPQDVPSSFFGYMYKTAASVVQTGHALYATELKTQMSNTVYQLAMGHVAPYNSIFSASEETKAAIFAPGEDGEDEIKFAPLARTVAGFAANQVTSTVAAKAVALAYDHLVGEVELQQEYELSCRVMRFVKNLPEDFRLLQEFIGHAVNAVPVGFIEETLAPMLAECVANTPLSMLCGEIKPGDDAHLATLKALFNVPGQISQSLQCKANGKYKGLVNKAIDKLEIPGLGSMQNANSIANLYQAYIKFKTLYLRFQSYRADLLQVQPALIKIHNAVKNGPAAASFGEWWMQPSAPPPECITDAIAVCNAMMQRFDARLNEMIPYLQAGRQGMFEVMDPALLAQQLVCATVNIGIHQAKEQSGNAVQFCANNFIDNCLTSAVYNAVIGPVSGLVSNIAPAGVLNLGASVGIQPENVVKAMAVFDAPIKQDVIAQVQAILSGLDKKVAIAGKCSVLYALGAIDEGAVVAALTLPALLKQFTRATSDVLLHHTLTKASSKQMIVEIQDGLAEIIRLCLTAAPSVPMIENAVLPAAQPSALVVAQPQLESAKTFGRKIGTHINQKLPQGLNKFGHDMGISGNIADEIMYPSSLTDKITSIASSVLNPFTRRADKGKKREERLNRSLR